MVTDEHSLVFAAKQKLKHIAVLLLCAPLLIGCQTTKATWEDWQREVGAGGQARGSADIPHAMPTPAAEAVPAYAPGYVAGDGARAGEGFDLRMRNPDFPRTHIEMVHIDLTGPDHHVRIKWAGPLAAQGPVGPWRSTPGRGKPEFDCDDVAQSNAVDSFCTPKGVFRIAGFSDHLRLTPQCIYATWVVHAPRYIAMHAHTDLPRKPASSGCVRLPLEAAKLIHNNSIAGHTLVSIDGHWKRP